MIILFYFCAQNKTETDLRKMTEQAEHTYYSHMHYHSIHRSHNNTENTALCKGSTVGKLSKTLLLSEMSNPVTEVLKYHRMEGKLSQTIKSDRVTCLSVAEDTIAIGTEEGFIHVVSLAGDIFKSFKAHDRAVNDVSIDNAGTTIASCSDNGTVVLQYLGIEGEKETVVHLNEPVKCVCVVRCISRIHAIRS